MTLGTKPDTLTQNVILDEIMIGDTALIVRGLTQQDIELLALVSGDINPANLDIDYASRGDFHKIVAHGMWGGALISAVLGDKLAGARNHLCGAATAVSCADRDRRPDHHQPHRAAEMAGDQADPVRLRLLQSAQREVITGTVEVRAPNEKICRYRIELPESASAIISDIERYAHPPRH